MQSKPANSHHPIISTLLMDPYPNLATLPPTVSFISMYIGKRILIGKLYITRLGKDEMILGLPFLS